MHKTGLADCPEYKLDTLWMEKESEGYWVIQPVSCNGKSVFFAFLMAGETLLLGDIDKE